MIYTFIPALFPLFFCVGSTGESKNKQLLKRFYHEVYKNWKMETADQLLSPDFVSHDWPAGQKGPQAFRNYYKVFKNAIPDASYEVMDMIADGDRVAVRWVMYGTYRASFPGIDIPPAGQKVELKGVAIYRVENEMLVERWVISDLYELLVKLQN